MEARLENGISMFNTVKAVCDANIATIDANVGVKDTYEQFLSMLTNAESLAQQQTLNRTGITEDKKNVREELAQTLEAAAGAIKAYADRVNNRELFASVHVKPSKLRTMRDQLLITHGQNVVDALNGHKDELTGMGVDKSYIADVSKMLEAYVIIVAKPTMARNNRKTATLLLNQKIKAIKGFLKNELDGIMLAVRKSNNSFYITYRNARRVVNNGVRHNTITTITPAA